MDQGLLCASDRPFFGAVAREQRGGGNVAIVSVRAKHDQTEIRTRTASAQEAEAYLQQLEASVVGRVNAHLGR